MSNVKEYVLEAIQKKYPIEPGANLDEFNYVANGYIDSLGMIQFVIELEDEFGIEFSDEDMDNPDFKIVNKLIGMIEKKVSELS